MLTAIWHYLRGVEQHSLATIMAPLTSIQAKLEAARAHHLEKASAFRADSIRAGVAASDHVDAATDIAAAAARLSAFVG